jgi:hypothetical protein
MWVCLFSGCQKITNQPILDMALFSAASYQSVSKPADVRFSVLCSLKKFRLFDMMAVQTMASSINLQSDIFFAYSRNPRNLQAMWSESCCSFNQKKEQLDYMSWVVCSLLFKRSQIKRFWIWLCYLCTSPKYSCPQPMLGGLLKTSVLQHMSQVVCSLLSKISKKNCKHNTRWPRLLQQTTKIYLYCPNLTSSLWTLSLLQFRNCHTRTLCPVSSPSFQIRYQIQNIRSFLSAVRNQEDFDHV